MNRPSRDAWLAIGLVLVLAMITIAAALTQTQQVAVPPYTSTSAERNGTYALWLWLEANGYRITNTISGSFAPPRDAALTLMLEPSVPVEEAEWRVLENWVEEGGTLVIAGEEFVTAITMNHLGYDMLFNRERVELLAPQLPILEIPPITIPPHVRTRTFIDGSNDDFAVLMAIEDRPVTIAFGRGEGLIILSTAPFPFSNAGLKEEGNPELVLNLIHTARREGVVWFDEWHHGIRSLGEEGVRGPQEWLFQTPAGQSLLYGAAVVFMALVLAGRHFGRPLAPSRERVRRAPLEYITAIANLNRRAGHRRFVLNQYHQRIKSELGRRYRISPALPDDEFLSTLASYNPALDVEAIRRALARLKQPKFSEAEMVDLAREAAKLLGEQRQ